MNTILKGNCLDVLRTLESESINCIVTSPPYWALRDYGTDGMIWDGDESCEHEWVEHRKKPTGGKGSKNANVGANKNDNANMRDHDVVSNFCIKCDAWRGSLGLEPTHELYVKHLCDIFDEVKRVLKKEGTCWVNIGDTYGGTGDKSGKNNFDPKQPKARNVRSNPPNQHIVPKSLIQIPARFAIEMTNRGWILRNEIIWHKPNVMPASVTDRFTVDFEKVFFFTKSTKYFFERQYEPLAQVSVERVKYGWKSDKANVSAKNTGGVNLEERGSRFANPKGRNKRAVWKIPTSSSRFSHIAMFPERLIEPMVKAGCPIGGVCLDPFFGSGTTGLVALKQGKRYIGIELNDEYIKIAEARIQGETKTLFV